MAAQALLGPQGIRTSGLGLCSLVVDIRDSLTNETIQEALELFKEPCVVEFDFDCFWPLAERDRVPLPPFTYLIFFLFFFLLISFRVKQLTNTEQNLFGRSFHLKEVFIYFQLKN